MSFKPTFFVPAPIAAPKPVKAVQPVVKHEPGKAPWPTENAPVAPKIDNMEAHKKRYGVELAKNDNAFQAACNMYEDARTALWVSSNWANDPIALASKDTYLKTLELSVTPLDKHQLAAKVLKFAEEKDIEGKRYLVEAKDRLAGYRLYSDIMGFTGKVDIDASTKNFVDNGIKVTFVRAEPKEQAPKVINQMPNTKSEILNEEPLPINVKLVGASSR